MVAPTRFKRLGVEGQASQQSNKNFTRNRGDYGLRVVSFVPKVVASTAAQPVGINIGPGGISTAYINVTTGEATGTTKTISVGYVGGSGSEIISGQTVDTDNTWIKVSGSGLVSSQENELSYTLGSADFVELDCEVVLIIVENNVIL